MPYPSIADSRIITPEAKTYFQARESSSSNPPVTYINDVAIATTLQHFTPSLPQWMLNSPSMAIRCPSLQVKLNFCDTLDCPLTTFLSIITNWTDSIPSWKQLCNVQDYDDLKLAVTDLQTEKDKLSHQIEIFIIALATVSFFSIIAFVLVFWMCRHMKQLTGYESIPTRDDANVNHPPNSKNITMPF